MADRGVASGQWRTWQDHQWSELPDASRLEVWIYTGRPSYEAGESIEFHVNTSAESFTLRVIYDGAQQEVVASLGPIAGSWHDTPANAPSHGCQWPVSVTLDVPEDWPSGGYVVVAEASDGSRTVTQDGFFAVRAAAQRRAPIALILSTYTWNAYNDWGGASSYTALRDRFEGSFSPRLSLLRPWARGTVRSPVGAPRFGSVSKAQSGWAVRHEWTEWAFANGYAHWAASAGWARYDALMARWLESEQIAFDVVTQWDLDRDPEILAGRACVITCGHDEYWTALGRKRLSDFIQRGGRHARFGGNILWQIRSDWNEQTTECFKFRFDQDPLHGGAVDERTGAFEGLAIGNPPVTDFGGNGARGGYAGWGGLSPRSARGFTIYRPRHWAFDGIDAYYGDLVGAKSGVVSYEADGVDYMFASGLPYPTGVDGSPETLEILALSPTSFEEEDHGNAGSVFDPLDNDLAGLSALLFGDDTPDNRDRIRYGSAVITSMPRGDGEVFCAGTTEWPYALDSGDPECETVTRNVLRRFTAVNE